MDFKKYICPVCNNRFADGDDVVVCPECGTPHHRECYKKENKCFNEHLHGTNEDLKAAFAVGEEEKNQSENEAAPFSMPNEKRNAEEGGKTISMAEIMLKNDGKFNSSPGSTHLIDGRPAVYYQIAVKSNEGYYIPRFTAMSAFKKNMSVNFIALLLPLTWSVYRKMYKFAAIILAIYMLIGGVTVGYMYSNSDILDVTQACMQEDMYFLEDVTEYLQEGTGKLTENQQKFIEELEKGMLPAGISMMFSLLTYAMKMFMGLKANSLYMKKIRATIESGEKAGLSGDTLKAYIYRKNGTFPIVLAVFIGIFEVFFL